jgi:hypothetical protein
MQNTPKSIYDTAANLIMQANFWMAGRGHFDVSEQELSVIIEMGMAGDGDSLKDFYEQLSEEAL